jgi:hypothetical protein
MKRCVEARIIVCTFLSRRAEGGIFIWKGCSLRTPDVGLSVSLKTAKKS